MANWGLLPNKRWKEVAFAAATYFQRGNDVFFGFAFA
jgi:hypothetical protein